MTYDIRATIAVLDDLIQTCHDGAEGFRSAAEGVRNKDARALFQSRVRRIEDAAVELQAAVRRLGGQPSGGGHLAAPAHRAWINLKSAISGGNDDAIIVEVERGEEYAVRRYEAALRMNLPGDLRMLIERQARGAEENLEIVRNLRRGTSLGTTQTMPVQPRPSP